MITTENKKRQGINHGIINAIAEYNQKYPDLRFHQILHNLNIIVTHQEFKDGIPTGNLQVRDQYHEESERTADRMNILNDD